MCNFDAVDPEEDAQTQKLGLMRLSMLCCAKHINLFQNLDERQSHRKCPMAQFFAGSHDPTLPMLIQSHSKGRQGRVVALHAP